LRLLLSQLGHLRDLPLIERKRRLARLLGRAKRRAIRFVEHLAQSAGGIVTAE
jgi:hypothetical protein